MPSNLHDKWAYIGVKNLNPFKPESLSYYDRKLNLCRPSLGKFSLYFFIRKGVVMALWLMCRDCLDLSSYPPIINLILLSLLFSYLFMAIQIVSKFKNSSFTFSFYQSDFFSPSIFLQQYLPRSIFWMKTSLWSNYIPVGKIIS